nr:MAG TPA: hypothetical protein [Bacteriophage sp.]DAV95138.1 MAG TPA: hypothetical protein [Caudoviricetes sp.]
MFIISFLSSKETVVIFNNMWVGIFTLHIHYCTNRGIINVTAMGKELPYSWLTAKRIVQSYT